MIANLSKQPPKNRLFTLPIELIERIFEYDDTCKQYYEEHVLCKKEIVYETIIEQMLMYPLDYGLEWLMTKEEVVTLEDFFANYRIFRVESTHSSCYQHAKITPHAPIQDILIARIDDSVGPENELLLQYQVSSLDVQRQGSSGSGFDQQTCMSQMPTPRNRTGGKGVDRLLSKLAVL